MQQDINQGRVAYEPNSLNGACPFQTSMQDGGFRTYARAVEGTKVRGDCGEKFFDHFTQARQFLISQSKPEQQHSIDAFQFERGKVTVDAIRERMVGMLGLVHEELAAKVADGLGLKEIPIISGPVNMGFPAGVNPREWQPQPVKQSVKPSPALSMTSRPGDAVRTRQVAVVIAEGTDGAAVAKMLGALAAGGATGRIVGLRLGAIKTTTGSLTPEFSLFTTSSVLFDGVFVPGGATAAALLAADPLATEFLSEAFKHYKRLRPPERVLRSSTRPESLERSHIPRPGRTRIPQREWCAAATLRALASPATSSRRLQLAGNEPGPQGAYFRWNVALGK